MELKNYLEFIKEDFEEKFDCKSPTYINELIDVFSFLIHDINIIPMRYKYKYSGSLIRTNFYIYIMYGGRIEKDDHEFLRELYGYHDIIKNLYNKDYFYINIEDKAIIIFNDYQKMTEFTYTTNYKHINVLNMIDIYDLDKQLIPDDIYQIIFRDHFVVSGDRRLRSGIKTKSGLSNMALFDWMYEPKNIDDIYKN